eukprot:1550453-Ditylum_brightwellii.AAC.1
MFNECNTVEKILIQQIVDAIDVKYLTAIRVPVTHQIMLTIPDIIDHLFDNYGNVTAEELRELREQVEQLPYQPAEPVDTIFTEIDMLSEVAKIAKRPLTAEQKIDMAYLLLQKTRKYKSNINAWNRRAANTKTWSAFKTKMREAQKGLRCTGELTVQDAINQVEIVNMVAEGIQ